MEPKYAGPLRIQGQKTQEKRASKDQKPGQEDVQQQRNRGA